jgi:hypothetical protein
VDDADGAVGMLVEEEEDAVTRGDTRGGAKRSGDEDFELPLAARVGGPF